MPKIEVRHGSSRLAENAEEEPEHGVADYFPKVAVRLADGVGDDDERDLPEHAIHGDPYSALVSQLATTGIPPLPPKQKEQHRRKI